MMVRKLGDILALLTPPYSANMLKPTRITMELADDGTFYNTRIEVGIINNIDGKTNTAYIQCKTNLSRDTYDFDVVYDLKSEDPEIFTLTVPEVDP